MNVNLIVLAICCYGITQTKAWGNSRCGYPPIGKHSVFNVSDDGLEVNYLCSPFNDPEQGNTTVVCDSNNVWVGQPLDCKDAVNCVDERLPCLNGGKCIEHEPSFSCQCPKSYLGALCDEANGNWGKWSSWSNCSSSCGDGVRIRTRECDDPKPTNKGMMCKKHSMEVKDCYGVRCPDTMYKWCRSEHDRCGQLEDRAFCSVWKSSFRCQCLEGVTRIDDQFGNFVRCEDFDECATYPTKMCDAETTNCVNTFGSYECVCKDGFDKYRGMCQDVNECVTGSHNCDDNARCINLVGTYTCECLDGYRSISSNDSAYDGECKEARTLLFGFKAKDARVRIVTMATGEHVTPIVAMPSGIPLQDANGNVETCKSFYATENGVLLITNLTSWSDNQWKESYRHPVDFKQGAPPYSTSPHICAWVAPMWTDTTFRHRAKMWYQLYDMDALVRVDKRKRKEKYRLSQRIQKLLPVNFRPKHVAIVTWDNVAPPWPSRGEEMTFQTILSTDGIRTFVTNIYEDQAMTWLPVYDVPRDVTEYQAVAGHYISGKSPKVWQHPASRKWSEKKGELNVYRLDQVRFKSTGILGIDTHPLTPSVDFESSPGHKCQKWGRGQPPVPRDVWALIGTCPPNMGEVLVFINTTWKLTTMEDERKCFQWNYNLSSGGGFECCYQTDRDGSPLIAGINAFRRGAGFYFVNKTSDAVMRKTCCENATSNYFCLLYALLRPPATFVYYKPPVYVSGSPGIELTTINGSSSSITGNGEVRLLRTEKQYFPNPLFDMIARIKTTDGEARISAVGFQAENVTVELYSEEGDGKIVCLIDKKPCDSVMSPNASSVVGDGWVAVSTRSGNFINASSSPDGGLSFEAYLTGSRLNNPNYVTYGLLSDTGDCVSAAYSNQNRDSVPCDLQSLAAVGKQSVEDLSFFTRFPQGQTAASYFAKPMSVTKVYQEINDRQMAPRNADVPEHLGRATAIAYQLQSGEYDVRINISAIDDDAIFDVTGALGNITMDGDDMVLRVDSSSLESLQIFLQEPNGTSLLFPDVTICACSGHGDCVINRDVTVGPHVTKAPCVCEVGYVGESCESKVDPCNGNPCFAGVRCAASPSGRLQAQCDPCPAPFQAGTGESCFHDNQCLTPATNLCVNALCVNRPYDYLCVCRPGFSKLSTSPYECEDIDECTEHHDCDSGTETCINLHGSYRCDSNDATATEKAEVKEVNECLANNGGCERRCKNTNGSFYCVCEIGYKLRPDGFSCEEIDECDAYGNEHCTGSCEDKIKGKPFQCKCDPRYKMADDYTTCIPLFTTTVPETFVTTSTTQQPLTTAEGLKKTTSVLTTVADTTTSKYVASTVKTTRDSTTTMEFTTTASFLSLLSKEDRDLWNEMQNIPGFADLSPAEQLRALELLKALARLLGDPDLSSLLLLLADLPRHASLSRRCTALNLAMKRRGMEIASLESKLKKAENLARRFTNPNILSLKPDFSRISPHFGSDDRRPRRLSFGEIFGYVELLRRCAELWRSRAEPTKAAAPQIERRHTPQRQSTAATTGPPKRIVHLPWVLAWIAIVTTLVVVIAFAAIIAGTRVCFSWKKGSEREKREKARKRKLERMKQWPRVVQTSYPPPGGKTSSIQW